MARYVSNKNMSKTFWDYFFSDSNILFLAPVHSVCNWSSSYPLSLSRDELLECWEWIQSYIILHIIVW